ncbi:EamA family transporter [Clostridium sp. MSJ-11]|uniref:EamA family transporter n=2 Tax=Clostridium mobile TaxID=2841512 RepID=A0ABS6EI05_9CLOT|nr:EamA family transporter [Clostridium mobile]MBU5484836.1 EamA family transporter [Clostridium mobile]
MNYLLLIINIFMLVCGQVLWKIGMSKIDFQLSFKGIINTLFNPYIFSGGIIYVFATIIWLYLLSKDQLSRIYPLQSLCYIVGAFAGVIIFNESLTISRILGLLLIFVGAILVVIK